MTPDDDATPAPIAPGSRMIVVTGGIGAGKSTVLKLLAQRGAQCVDADDLAHGLYAPGSPVTRAIAEHFGSHFLTADGAPDRGKLAAVVFQDPGELEWLNRLTHPRIRQRLLQAASAAAPQPLFAAIPLWYESGWTLPVETTVVAVWCSSDTQRQRLRQRGWSDQDIRRRLAAQLSMDEKYARADYGIVTECSWERLAEQCSRLLERLAGTAAKSADTGN